MNDPAIYEWIEGPPTPYLPEHADFWIRFVKGESDATLEYLRKSAEDFPDGPLQFVDANPVPQCGILGKSKIMGRTFL